MSSSAPTVRALHQVGHADAVDAGARAGDRGRACHDARGERGGPEPVARAGEADAGVGRVHARVEAAQQQPHAGADGVGQRARRGRPSTSIHSFAVVDGHVDDVEARRPRARRASSSGVPPAKKRPAKSSSGNGSFAVALDHVRCSGRADGESPGAARSSANGSRSARDVQVARVAHAAAERAAPERQRLEVGVHAGHARAQSSRRDRPSPCAASSATAGRGRCGEVQPGAAPEVGGDACPGGTASRRAGERVEEPAASAIDPLLGARLVHRRRCCASIAGRIADMTQACTMNGEIRVVDDVAAGVRGARRCTRRRVDRALGRRAPPSSATTLLAVAGVDWSGVDVFFGDERFVPVDDPDSNEGMARATCCSTRCEPGRSTRCAAPAPSTRPPRRRTTRSCAPRRRSTSCTSGSVPTATPRRCSRGRPRSTRPSASWSPTPATPPPAPAPHLHLSGDRASRLVVVTVAGRGEARRVRPHPGRRRPSRRRTSEAAARALARSTPRPPGDRPSARRRPRSRRCPGASRPRLRPCSAPDPAHAARRAARRADGARRRACATPPTATASPSRRRCSSRSRCCAATAAATARSPSRRPASTAPYLDARRGARDRARAAPRSAATRRCSRSARRPRTRYPQAAEWLAAHGYASTVDYLVAAARAVLDETGLLPHANAGALVRGRARAAAGGGRRRRG